MGSRHDYAINRKILVIIGTRLGVADRDWRKNFVRMERFFFIFVATTQVFDKTICAVTTKLSVFGP